MSHQLWLTAEQVGRLRPHFPKVRGKRNSDDRMVLLVIIHMKRAFAGDMRRLLMDRTRPSTTGSCGGPGWGRWAHIFRDLALPGMEGDTLMMDSSHTTSHRRAASLSEDGSACSRSAARRAA